MGIGTILDRTFRGRADVSNLKKELFHLTYSLESTDRKFGFMIILRNAKDPEKPYEVEQHENGPVALRNIIGVIGEVIARALGADMPREAVSAFMTFIESDLVRKLKVEPDAAVELHQELAHLI